MVDRRKLIDIFVLLGQSLEQFGEEEASRQVILSAEKGNGWFQPSDICNAVAAIRTTMLDHEKLEAWLAPYPCPVQPKNVALILAGNIPLVGFFDLLCVLISGHRCWVKLSSKDRVLMQYIISRLRKIAPELPIFPFDEEARPDAVIATGSDNANRYFRSRFGTLPALFRGNRSSVAVLTGEETDTQLNGLARDIFLYSGLGCRNVSHLLWPEGYDPTKLCNILSQFGPVNDKYLHNFYQRKALLKMQQQDFTEGAFFLLRRAADFSSSISEITYHTYANPKEARQWIRANQDQIQCLVGNDARIPNAVPFGMAQSPSLTDYADSRDTMAFLCAL